MKIASRQLQTKVKCANHQEHADPESKPLLYIAPCEVRHFKLSIVPVTFSDSSQVPGLRIQQNAAFRTNCFELKILDAEIPFEVRKASCNILSSRSRSQNSEFTRILRLRDSSWTVDQQRIDCKPQIPLEVGLGSAMSALPSLQELVKLQCVMISKTQEKLQLFSFEQNQNLAAKHAIQEQSAWKRMRAERAGDQCFLE